MSLVQLGFPWLAVSSAGQTSKACFCRRICKSPTRIIELCLLTPFAKIIFLAALRAVLSGDWQLHFAVIFQSKFALLNFCLLLLRFSQYCWNSNCSELKCPFWFSPDKIEIDIYFCQDWQKKKKDCTPIITLFNLPELPAAGLGYS